MNVNANFKIDNINSEEDYINNYSTENYKIFGLFDGHGSHEIVKVVSDGLEENDVKPFCQYMGDFLEKNDNNKNIKNLIEEAFNKYDLLLQETYPYSVSGTTATLLIITKEKGYIAYIGDSKAIVLKDNKILIETKDHKYLDNETEKDRLDNNLVPFKIGNDIDVMSDKEINIVQSFIHSFGSHPRIEKLAVTRAFGHYFCRHKNLNKTLQAIPDIIEFDINTKNNMKVILASDGFWDMVNKRDISNTIQKILSENSNIYQSEALTSYAVNRWKQEWTVIKNNQRNLYTMPFGSWDDVSTYYIEII